MATDYIDRVKIECEARLHRNHAEDGYVLVAVIFVLALLMLSLALAAPRIKQSLERDREAEAMNRGKQYIRAVRLYYKKFNAYPPNMEALEKTNELRFLRKRYIDPITGKDDWHPILMGQNKVPTVMGFFGQTLAIASTAGIGPGSAVTGNAFNSPNAVSNEDAPPAASASDSAGNTTSGTPNQDPAGGNGSPGSSTGQTFGGAGIIGFSIPSEKQSILVYKKQSHFNQWEFVYDPLQETAFNAGAGTTAGGNSGATGSPTAPGWPGSGAPTNSPWGPNGNLPAPVGPGNGAPTNSPWGPNGNLPPAPPQ